MKVGNIKVTDGTVLIQRILKRIERDGIVEVTLNRYGDVGCNAIDCYTFYPNYVGKYTSKVRRTQLADDLRATWKEMKR